MFNLTMSKVKTTDIPSRAKHLFINLYCEKNGGKTDENKHIASQSWLSLSYAKKQHFYDTISTKAAIKRGQRIVQTKPYLREKIPSNSRKRKQLNTEANVEAVSELDNIHHTVSDCDTSESMGGTYFSDVLEQNGCQLLPDSAELEPECALEENAEESELRQNECQSSLHNPIYSFSSVIDADKTDDEDELNRNIVKVPLTEPVLPIAKTGKELFELLRIRNGINKTYEMLTSQEKKMYAHATSAIKKDYVKRYKEYLESLAPKQLFDYYMKVFP